MTKYGNKTIYTPEGKFDSRKEYRRWTELRLMERAGIYCSVSVGTDYKPGAIVYVITIPKEEEQ